MKSGFQLNFLKICLSVLALISAVNAYSFELKLSASKPFIESNVFETRPGQLPLSKLVRSKDRVSAAWLIGATRRYTHGVLGDSLEAGGLVVETNAGKQLRLNLPANRVFEDLEPRLIDLDDDNQSEILLVESDLKKGASLAVYGIVDGRIRKRAATPFIGTANRWLNPLGVGDFDGDGKLDIALVETPHIGGILRLYRFTTPVLTKFAEYTGVSTHKLGSTELGLGKVIPAQFRDRILIPNQSRQVLMMLEYIDKQFQILARKRLPGALQSSLVSIGKEHWRFQIHDGRYFEIKLVE